MARFIQHTHTHAVAKNNPDTRKLAVVAGVGALVTLLVPRVVPQLVLGTGLYTLGYFAKQEGWLDRFIYGGAQDATFEQDDTLEQDYPQDDSL